MSTLNILLVAVALAMDAMAVAAANGAHHRSLSRRKALTIAASFGLFQLFMPLVGWMLGTGFKNAIMGFDHWLAFTLLSLIGIKMVWESFKPVEERNICINSIGVLLLLSVATSTDALVVGVTFAFVPTAVALAVILIGLVTFGLSLAAISLGKICGDLWGKKAETFGGLVLVAIGVKILVTHLW
ncbi:MAG: manganese efflux pump MntP family protein [Patescibacteria group bacterium]|nr:manganese efflux pump MntP family protein [Patescibacteria group bacterium]